MLRAAGGAMTINNRWYDDLNDDWWDRNGPVASLHDLNPARFAYFKGVLGRLEGLKVLDVGCGGGLLVDRFARAGAVVTGVDLSESSVVAASRHLRAERLAAQFVAGSGGALPFLSESFDAVVSADFLEHVADLDGVIKDCARVLKPSGLFLYETINRTLRSRVIAVWLFERVLGLIPEQTHDPALFIKPAELREAMARHGLVNRETRGIGPKAGKIGALFSIIKAGRIGDFTITDDTAMAYIGYGLKDSQAAGQS